MSFRAGPNYRSSATPSPLIRFTEVPRTPFTWSLAPVGWDGLSWLECIVRAAQPNGMKARTGWLEWRNHEKRIDHFNFGRGTLRLSDFDSNLAGRIHGLLPGRRGYGKAQRRPIMVNTLQLIRYLVSSYLSRNRTCRRIPMLLRLALIASLQYVPAIAAQSPGDEGKLSETYRAVDQGAYDQVLNLIFPRAPAVEKDVIFTMTLRFIPAFDPESQVSVTFFAKKAPFVDYTVAKKQVYATANEMIRAGGKPQPDTIARSIPVRHGVFKIPSSRVLAWQRAMFQNLGATLLPLRRETQDLYRHGTAHLVLDGTIYEVGYAQGSAEFHDRFNQATHGPAIAKWAESVRMEIMKQQAQE
jgi:hypothetical protein